MPTAIINGKKVVYDAKHQEVVEIDGEKRIVSAGEAKKLLKALKAASAVAARAPPAPVDIVVLGGALPAAAGGGKPAFAPAPVGPAPGKRDIRSNAEKAQDANLAEIDAELAKNPVQGLWSHYRNNIFFYRVDEVEGSAVKASCLVRLKVKKDKLAAFLAEDPTAAVTEPEYVRVRKILPRPDFGTQACAHDEEEVTLTRQTELEVTPALLKDNGKVGLRELKAGAIVAVRIETGQIRKTVWVGGGLGGGGHHAEKMVSESHRRVFAVVPEDRYEAYEVAHDVPM